MISKKAIETIRKLITITLNPILRIFVIIWFWFFRWIKHNRFLIWLNNKQVGKPSIIALPFVFTNELISIIKRMWAVAFSEYALKKYKLLLEIHYSEKGVGYLNYNKLSQVEYLKIYNELSSRAAHYITHNSTILHYNDGDSFLDVGCGKGQNIRELIARYPNSMIKGFDVSTGALRVVQTVLKGNSNVQVEVGSVVDFQYLDSYPTGAFDHLIVSHVFALLIDSGVDKTRKLRQTLIDHFIRIAAKSVLIMDGDILSETEVPEVIIEQNTRCVFRESLIPYFAEHQEKGELYSMFSTENTGIIFRLKNNAL
jgi:SAM-dependent methyltransferase